MATKSPIRTERHGDVLVIISDNPPVNALGADLRAARDAALARAIGDASVRAIVLAAEGKVFVGGADIVREMFQSGELKPHLTEQGIAVKQTA